MFKKSVVLPCHSLILHKTSKHAMVNSHKIRQKDSCEHLVLVGVELLNKCSVFHLQSVECRLH